VDLPRKKRVDIALRYLFGIGPTTAVEIINKTGVNPATRVNDLTEEEVARIRQVIDQDYKVEGNLRSETAMNIKRLQEIGSYRGQRHRKGLPVRGQRTRTNARTRKGPKPGIGAKTKKKTTTA
jgi:small subunit ribosomal protein S13